MNKYKKLYAKEFDLECDDYRDIIQKEKTDYINKKLKMLPIHKELSKIDLKKTQMDFDSTSLYYRRAMGDHISVCPKIENWLCL